MSDSVILSSVDEVLGDVRQGKFVIIVDDADRENEGDLSLASELVESEHVAFMMREARGLICISISDELAHALNLPPQVENNNSRFRTPFAVSINHREVAERGVTAAARAYTMKQMVSGAKGSDFLSPGHVFPLVANPSGVFGRQGQTEGSYDLARLAGFKPSGIICEILNEDGTMARGRKLNEFAARFGIKITSIEEIIRYRLKAEVLVRKVAEAELMTDYGLFKTCVYVNEVDNKEHLVLVYGDVGSSNRKVPLVRVHSECLTGDVLGSRRCDCGGQLAKSMESIVEYGCGIVLYLRQEGRGIGLLNKLKAYHLQDLGRDTVEANIELGFAPDSRDFVVAGRILETMGVRKVKVLTNNTNKLNTLENIGINVVERIPLIMPRDEYNSHYLETKRDKMGHLL